jgi:hypothetical protein
MGNIGSYVMSTLPLGGKHINREESAIRGFPAGQECVDGSVPTAACQRGVLKRVGSASRTQIRNRVWRISSGPLSPGR